MENDEEKCTGQWTPTGFVPIKLDVCMFALIEAGCQTSTW